MSVSVSEEALLRTDKRAQVTPAWQVMYHGTARKLLAFRPHAVAYFSPHFDDGRAHALMDAEVEGGTPRVLCCRLSITNPARIDTLLMQDLHSLPDEVARLLAMGHDCAIGEHETGEIAVFGNTHIHTERIVEI